MFANYKDVVYQCVIVAYWMCNFGAGLDAFVLPPNWLVLVLVGVGLILYYLTGLSVGSWNVILNVPIFWAAWKWLGTPCSYQNLVWYADVILDD